MSAAEARERRIGFACAIGVMVVWAGFLLTSRLSAKQAFTPYDVLMLRHLGAFLAALPVLAWHGWPRLRLFRAVVLTAFAGFGFPLLAFIGFGLAPASHGAVMLPGMLPFLTAILWWLAFGERWTTRRVLSLAVVAAGIAMLARDTFGTWPGAWRGDLLFLGGGASWALYMACVRRWKIGALDATLAVALLSAPLTLPLWWVLLPSNIGAVSTGALLYQLIYQGVLAVLVAGFLFTRAMNTIGAPLTSTITSLVPALTALGAWPLLGETLGAGGLAGIALVTAGMLVGVVPLRVDPRRRAT